MKQKKTFFNFITFTLIEVYWRLMYYKMNKIKGVNWMENRWIIEIYFFLSTFNQFIFQHQIHANEILNRYQIQQSFKSKKNNSLKIFPLYFACSNHTMILIYRIYFCVCMEQFSIEFKPDNIHDCESNNKIYEIIFRFKNAWTSILWCLQI